MEKKDPNILREVFGQLAMVGQLGLSLIMPLLLCMGLCFLLTRKAGLGSWVYIPGFILGIGGGISVAISFGKQSMRSAEGRRHKGTDRKRKKGTSFNEHF